MLVGDVYSRCAPLWTAGPDAIYGLFAECLVEEARVGPEDLVLDVGSGAGAVARALLGLASPHARHPGPGGPAGAKTSPRVVTTDLSSEMLRCGPPLPSVIGDGTRLPFARGTFDVALSAFVVSHVPRPEHLLAESARVVRAGGRIVTMTFEDGPPHPAIAQVEEVAREFRWIPPAWYPEQRRWASLTDTAGGLESIAVAAGLRDVVVQRRHVGIDGMDGLGLVLWRLGHAHMAEYVLGLPPPLSENLVSRAVEVVGEGPHALWRSLLIASSTVAA